MTSGLSIGTTSIMLGTLFALAVTPPDAGHARSDSSRGEWSRGMDSRETRGQPQEETRGRQSYGSKGRFSEVRGEIDRAKKVRVLGSDTDHLVVLLYTDHRRWMAVDLGPIETWRGIRIRTGDWIAARGPIGTMGNRRVLMAHRVMTDDGDMIRIDRQRQRIAGTIEGLKTIKVRGTETDNLLALIQTDDGRRIVADLGDAKHRDHLRLKKGDYISVRGPRVQIEGRPVMMARQIQAEGEVKQITRVYPTEEGVIGIPASASLSDEDVGPMLKEAIRHARQAERAAHEEQSEAVIEHAQRALRQVQQAEQVVQNERLHESTYALRDAIDHSKEGHAKDAGDHLRHAIMRLSQAAGTQVPEGMDVARQDQRDTVGDEARPMVLEAIQHAIAATNAGQQGQSEVIAQHAWKAIDKVKEAQKVGHNERLNEGIFALSDAIDHAKQGDTKDATEHASRAVATLSQAVGHTPREVPQGGGEQAAGRQAGMETVEGEVVVKGEVLKIDRDGFYVIKDPSGREVHLLVSEGMNRGFRVGDTVTAQVKPDGTVRSIQKQDESENGRSDSPSLERQRQPGLQDRPGEPGKIERPSSGQ